MKITLSQGAAQWITTRYYEEIPETIIESTTVLKGKEMEGWREKTSDILDPDVVRRLRTFTRGIRKQVYVRLCG